jgi:peptidoglycan endopeptidase LytF
MRRRDAVLIAVLVNAGLLVFLFALAVTGSEDPGRSFLHSSGHELVELVPAASSGEESLRDGLHLASADAGSDSALAFVPTISLGEPELPTHHETLAVAGGSAHKTTYTVKKGDALERIAKQHGISVANLMKANQLKSSSKLSVGQVLSIPTAEVAQAKPSVVQEVEASKGAATQVAAKFYTVQKGDNVWAIATRHQLKTEELLRLNKMTPEMARRLQPGDRLRVK